MGYGHGVVIRHGFKREAGVRKVFNNDMLAHVWAQQDQSEGQNHKGTAWFAGEWFYSYRTAIARIYTTESGARVLLIRDERFSVTTSQHMPGRSVFNGPAFEVPFIGNCEGQTKERYAQDWKNDNARVFVHRWQAAVAAAFKRAPHVWANEMERQVNGQSYSYAGFDSPPADFDTAAANYESRFVESLMDYRAQCLAYCDALLVAYPIEFNSEREARELATQQAREIVTRFRRVLDDPKRQAKREAAAKRRDAAAQRYADSMFAKRKAWLETDDAQLMALHRESGVASISPAPSIPHRWHRRDRAKSGLTGAQLDAALTLLIDLENDCGQSTAIREKEARLEHIANAERREREREQFERWQSGDLGAWVPSSYRQDERGGAYLRRVTRDGRDLIQTSQGAEVLFSDAVRLFRFAKLIRERCYFPEMDESASWAIGWQRNGSTLRVTHFQLESVCVDGSCRVGCHFLSWESIESTARACGVFDLEAADTTEHRGQSHDDR